MSLVGACFGDWLNEISRKKKTNHKTKIAQTAPILLLLR